MKKSLKVKKLIDQNGIEIQNFTMVLRLKKIVQQLNFKIKQQDQIIMELKRDSKTTKINQMEVEIQHLNDQNKRLVLLIEEIKHKNILKKDMQGSYAKAISMGYVLGSKPSGEQGFVRTADNATKLRQRKKKSQNKKDSPSGSLMFGSGFSFGSQLISYSTKKSYPEAQKQKQQQMKQQLKQRKFQKKYYQLLQQTQKLKKQLINIKLNEQSSGNKRGKSCVLIDKNNVFFEKNMECLQKITQKKHELEVENEILRGRLAINQRKLKDVEWQNETNKKTADELKSQIKRNALLKSDKSLIVNNKSGILKDLSNQLPEANNKLALSIY